MIVRSPSQLPQHVLSCTPHCRYGVHRNVTHLPSHPLPALHSEAGVPASAALPTVAAQAVCQSCRERFQSHHT